MHSSGIISAPTRVQTELCHRAKRQYQPHEPVLSLPKAACEAAQRRGTAGQRFGHGFAVAISITVMRRFTSWSTPQSRHRVSLFVPRSEGWRLNGCGIDQGRTLTQPVPTLA